MPDKLPPIVPDNSKDKPAIALPPRLKGGNPVFSFLQPRGDWRVSVGEYVFKAFELCVPGREYRVEVNTLCGSDIYDAIECSPLYAMTAVEFARRIQIVGSIQHVTRRSCKVCLAAYRDGLAPDEKRWLYSTKPEMGAAMGFEGAQILADLDDGKIKVQPPSKEANPTSMTPPPYRMPTLAQRLSDSAGR